MRNENGTGCRGEKLEKETKMEKRNLCIYSSPLPLQFKHRGANKPSFPPSPSSPPLTLKHSSGKKPSLPPPSPSSQTVLHRKIPPPPPPLPLSLEGERGRGAINGDYCWKKALFGHGKTGKIEKLKGKFFFFFFYFDRPRFS